MIREMPRFPVQVQSCHEEPAIDLSLHKDSMTGVNSNPQHARLQTKTLLQPCNFL